MKKSILLLITVIISFSSYSQDKYEILSKFNYATTTQHDGTKRTSKFLSVLVSVNSTNNLIVVDEEIKSSKSLVYLNNTQREEKIVNGKMVIHYDSPKYGENQIAYLDDNSLTLILPNKQKLIFSINKPLNTTMVE